MCAAGAETPRGGPRLNRCRLRSIVAVLFALAAATLEASTVLDEPIWRRQDADIRLCVAPASRRPHLLRIDLPRSCRTGVKGVCAFLDGRPVPASPVSFHGGIVGVECLLPWHRLSVSTGARPADDATRMPLEVYLLGVPEVPVPCPPEQRTPIQLERTIKRLTTRPFSPQEFVRLTTTLTRRLASVDLAEFVSSFSRSYWNEPAERTTAVLHWATDLRLQRESDLRFGADQSHVAWFLWIDGECVADWRSGEALLERGTMGDQRHFEPGFHRVDFFAVQRVGEPVPLPLMQESGRPPIVLPQQDLFPVRRPAAMLVSRRNAVLNVGIAVRDLQRFVARDTGAEVLLVDSAGMWRHLFDRKIITQRLHAEGRMSSDTGVSALAVTGSVLPKLQLTVTDELGYEARAVLPSRTVWVPPVLMAPVIRVGGLPSVLAAEQALTFSVSIELAEDVRTRVGAALHVTCCQLDAGGQTVAEQVLEGAATGGASHPVRVALHSRAVAIRVACAVEGAAVALPRQIRIVRPGSVQADIVPRGGGLFVGREPAVLVCDPLVPLTRERPERPDQGVKALVLVDDFWAGSSGPDAALLPEDWLGASPFPLARRFAICASDAMCAAPELRKFGALHAALSAEARGVVWSVGFSDLAAGRDALDVCLHLLFLAQATSARGAVPVLFALPDLPGVARSETRRVALHTKELAWRLGVPVIDAFSRARQEEEAGKPFADFFQSLDGRASLLTPNDEGRAWLCQVFQEELAEETGELWR